MCSRQTGANFSALNQTWSTGSNVLPTKWAPYGNYGNQWNVGKMEVQALQKPEGYCHGCNQNNSIAAYSYTQAGNVGPGTWNRQQLLGIESYRKRQHLSNAFGTLMTAYDSNIDGYHS